MTFMTVTMDRFRPPITTIKINIRQSLKSTIIRSEQIFILFLQIRIYTGLHANDETSETTLQKLYCPFPSI